MTGYNNGSNNTKAWTGNGNNVPIELLTKKSDGSLPDEIIQEIEDRIPEVPSSSIEYEHFTLRDTIPDNITLKKFPMLITMNYLFIDLDSTYDTFVNRILLLSVPKTDYGNLYAPMVGPNIGFSSIPTDTQVFNFKINEGINGTYNLDLYFTNVVPERASSGRQNITITNSKDLSRYLGMYDGTVLDMCVYYA